MQHVAPVDSQVRALSRFDRMPTAAKAGSIARG
jgi:hypothetical protein